MLVQEFFERTADRLPNKIALVADERRWTYLDIETSANRLANALRENGIRRGDRVVIYLPNCSEAVVSFLGILKAGGVFVIVNPNTKYQKLSYIIQNSQARAVITSGPHAQLGGYIDQADSVDLVMLTTPTTEKPLSKNVLFFDQVFSCYSASRPACINIDLDLACLIYTSGSTGDPKGVMSDHSNVDFASSSITQYLRNVESDIVLDVLPLSFDYGLYQVLMTFKFGGTLILEKGFLFPAAILKKIKQEKVTGFPCVPTIFSLLLSMDLSEFDFSSLRYITNTAAALPVNHIHQLREKFPGVLIYSMYGLTETKRTLYLPPEELDRRPSSVGIAIPGTEVWLVDDNGNKVGPGNTGELVVRGRHVMRGYWREPELTEKRFRAGPLPGERVCYSGDLFRMDEEGYLYFLARKDDILKCKGEKVSPVEVERAIYDIPGVIEVAVIGVPDPILGQAIKAFIVVSDPNIDTSAVLQHCRRNLEDFMVPKYLEFRKELPKTESGKIKKTDLH